MWRTKKVASLKRLSKADKKYQKVMSSKNGDRNLELQLIHLQFPKFSWKQSQWKDGCQEGGENREKKLRYGKLHKLSENQQQQVL